MFGISIETNVILKVISAVMPGRYGNHVIGWGDGLKTGVIVYMIQKSLLIVVLIS